MEKVEALIASHNPSHKVAVTWHQKLGHMSEQGMKILVERKLLPGLIKVSLPFCEHCVIIKQHRLKFKTSNSRSVSVLELVTLMCVKHRFNPYEEQSTLYPSLMIIPGDVEPSTLQEALNNLDASNWKEAMEEEIEALQKNKTWELVPLPGEQLDVKTAFIHGNFEEEIYLLQPEGFKQKGKENLVSRLHAYPCAYFKRFGNNDFIILLLYVDDMLVAGPNKDRINKLKAQLNREFEMKDLG
ncbi:retrovirus-related pol polyprotein from transposon TNT 1-94, partial [Tanacetum coccineum]